MEGSVVGASLRIRVPIPSLSTLGCVRVPLSGNGCSRFRFDCSRKPCYFPSIRAQKPEAMKNSNVDSVEMKDLESGKSIDDLRAKQGITIRRRPSTGPPQHHVGPFEFRLENEGNTPRNILEKIVWNKDVEVSQMKEKKPLLKLKKDMDNAPPARDFIGALKESYVRTGMPALIAEVKKASPSRGVLRDDFDPIEIARAYEKGGASCLSVLTDQKFFQGSYENLEAIRSAGVKCPLLCKEFIIDAWQIYYARTKGADAILLISSVLPDPDIKYLSKICKLLGMAALVEVHNEREMDRVLAIDGIQLIGINNRDLETFEVDISNTRKLLEGERGEIISQRDIIVVGESALFTPADIAYAQESGARAVLVGESIVKQQNPTEGITSLFGKDISKRIKAILVIYVNYCLSDCHSHYFITTQNTSFNLTTLETFTVEENVRPS